MTRNVTTSERVARERSRQAGLFYEQWSAGQDPADPKLEGLPADQAFAVTADDDFHAVMRRIYGLPPLGKPATEKGDAGEA